MGISIITPHYNDFEGIKQIYECLTNQNSDQWEWIIVDDFSNIDVKSLLQEYIKEQGNLKVKLFFNRDKTNASVCRNIGIDNASNTNLIFLDSDDIILEDFVTNRLIRIEEFCSF